MHITSRFNPVACVMKTFSSHTIGEALPRSGNGARQRTFSVLLHFTGTFFSGEIPVPSLRHAGQFAAVAEPMTHRVRTHAAHRERKRCSPDLFGPGTSGFFRPSAFGIRHFIFMRRSLFSTAIAHSIPNLFSSTCGGRLDRVPARAARDLPRRSRATRFDVHRLVLSNRS